MKQIKIIKILIIVFLGILAISVITIYYLRTSIYEYDVANDYNYNFKNSDALIYPLQLKNGQVNLSNFIKKNRTGFIKLSIKSNLLSYLFQPNIIASSENLRTDNYFEHGVNGIRYLNISEFLALQQEVLVLEGVNLKIQDQSIELILFNEIDLKTSKILIISPHPDDAEIAAFGVYSQNKNSHIVTITAGEAGYFNYKDEFSNKSEHSLQKGMLRTWNSVTIPLLGGVNKNNSLNLGFFDTTLKKMYFNDSTSTESVYIKTSNINTFRKINISILKDSLSGVSNWKSLKNNLKFILEKVQPDIIVCPHPLLDSHDDHKYSTIATIEALIELNYLKGNLLFYTNHFPNCDFYPFGMEGQPISLPPNFNSDLYFKSIYSHSLNKIDQRNKLFALEAMNDLRINTQWRHTNKLIKMTLKTIAKDVIGINDNYFRKSIRSNELFFVIPIKDLYDNKTISKIINDN